MREEEALDSRDCWGVPESWCTILDGNVHHCGGHQAVAQKIES